MSNRNPDVMSFFDPATWTVTHLVADPAQRVAAIIDPVLDFDPKSGRTGTKLAEEVLAAARSRDWTIKYILETHAHADHITAAPFLKARTGAPIGIGERIRAVQEKFMKVFNLDDLTADGRAFDLLLSNDQKLTLGSLEIEVMATPGHTPACVTYKVGDAAFIGDTLFMPDYGTARADFPGGDARVLFRSIQKILSLPAKTRLFMCHDYGAPGRSDFKWETTVAEERAKNVHVHDGVTEDEFVAMRTARDITLQMPVLILPSIQVNIRAGQMPTPEQNGVSYLKLPINAL